MQPKATGKKADKIDSKAEKTSVTEVAYAIKAAKAEEKFAEFIINKKTQVTLMPNNSRRVSAELGLRYLQSFCNMKETMKYLTDKEQLHTQHISVWFYIYGTGRV